MAEPRIEPRPNRAAHQVRSRRSAGAQARREFIVPIKEMKETLRQQIRDRLRKCWQIGATCPQLLNLLCHSVKNQIRFQFKPGNHGNRTLHETLRPETGSTGQEANVWMRKP